MSDIIEIVVTELPATEVIEVAAPDAIDVIEVGTFIDNTTVNNINNGAYFEWTQAIPSAVWTIPHGLHYYPGGISVQDSTGRPVEGYEEHIDTDTLQITFSAAISGKAHIS